MKRSIAVQIKNKMFCLNHFIEAETYFKSFKVQETTTNMLYGGKRAETVLYETIENIICYMVI